MKISRNDLCPCGSGKKYKKCCMGKFNPEITEGNEDLQIRWTLKMVEELETDEIFQKLMRFGIIVNKDMFIAEVQASLSADEILKRWEKHFHLNINNLLIDFTFLAIKVLSARLVPEYLLIEHIEDKVSKGYLAWETKNNDIQAAEIWNHAWQQWKQWLKDHNITSLKSLKKMEDKMSFFFLNWIQDFDMVLHNAGITQLHMNELRYQFAEDILTIFNDLDLLLKENFTRAKGEALFNLGKMEETNKLFENYAAKYTNCPWIFINWGDLYNPELRSNQPDTERAISLYKEAIERATDDGDREAAEDRLYELENV